jgi:2-polyprenyl-3-methyl-5-hydroxy-6-metoxy-1,4-benzoquinol methylase
MPPGCERVLDVGCGEGVLALQLSRRVGHVVAIDLDAPTIELARQGATAENVEYIVGDFLSHAFDPSSFDAVVSVATLHHMPTAIALERMNDLLRPGGTLVVVGLAHSHRPENLVFHIAGSISTRFHKFTKTYWETAAPKIWPPPEPSDQTRRIAASALPGVRYRRHILWRYSLIWEKPIGHR